jgi:predicted ATPase
MMWLAAITLGFVGTALVRNMRPMAAAGTLFLIVSGAPILMALTTAVTAETRERDKRNRR